MINVFPFPAAHRSVGDRSLDVRGYIRGCKGGQAISFEEGSFVDVKVEFTHSKVIDFDHPPPCSFPDANGSHPKRARRSRYRRSV